MNHVVCRSCNKVAAEGLICQTPECANFGMTVVFGVPDAAMSRDEQLELFSRELNTLLNKFGAEYDLSGLEVLGLLFCTQHRIAVNILANPPKPPKKGS
jgi:hypothetical protein